MRSVMRAFLVVGLCAIVCGIFFWRIRQDRCLSVANKPIGAEIVDIEHAEGVVGRHVVAELRGCKNCDFSQAIYDVLKDAVKAANATLLHTYVHKFEPQGMTGIAVLAESHISFHTWPETGYVAVDVFTCGAHTDPEAALQVLKNFFQADDMLVWHFDRGRNGYVQD